VELHAAKLADSLSALHPQPEGRRPMAKSLLAESHHARRNRRGSAMEPSTVMRQASHTRVDATQELNNLDRAILTQRQHYSTSRLTPRCGPSSLSRTGCPTWIVPPVWSYRSTTGREELARSSAGGLRPAAQDLSFEPMSGHRQRSSLSVSPQEHVGCGLVPGGYLGIALSVQVYPLCNRRNAVVVECKHHVIALLDE
jgi:hypothetical protein